MRRQPEMRKINFQSMSIKFELMHHPHNGRSRKRKIWRTSGVGKFPFFRFYRCSVITSHMGSGKLYLQNKAVFSSHHQHRPHIICTQSLTFRSSCVEIFEIFCIINESFCVIFGYAEILK